MKTRPYRLAHLSDLHLESVDEEFEWTLHMVDDALDRGADHIALTGDIVDAAQIDVLISLLRKLGAKGLDAGELSFVPGNHDIYPLAWEQGFEDESIVDGASRLVRNAKRAARGLPRHVTRSADAACRRLLQASDALNGRDARLFRNTAIPYGKRLADHVVLAGVDTTRCAAGDGSPNDIATGQLPPDDLDKMKEFFAEHADVEHRVVLMHHYPFNDFGSDSPWFPMEFVEPDAATVRNWLGWAGATTVLCGHIHKERRRRTREGFEVITSDSSCYHLVKGGTGRAYSLVELPPSGRVSVARVRVEEGRRSFIE